MSAIDQIDLERDLQVLPASLFYRVTEREFGTAGLVAIESVGPFASVMKVGPFLMIHDGFIEPAQGIGHHPHRTNERLFYIIEGQLDHDDALNAITGTMREGDLVRLTEGLKGMWHREWNGRSDKPTRAFILVYTPDVSPPIPTAEFAALRAADRVRREEAPGVETLELIGARSKFRSNNSRIRLFLDTTLPPRGRVPIELEPNAGLLLYPIAGEATVATARETREPIALRAKSDVHPEGPDGLALVWSDAEPRQLELRAGSDGARVLRVGFARGEEDLVVREIAGGQPRVVSMS